MTTREPKTDDPRGVHTPNGGCSRRTVRGKLLLSAALIGGCAVAALFLLAQTQGLAQAPMGAAEYGAGGGPGYGNEYGEEMGMGMMGGYSGAGYAMGSMMPGQNARSELHARLEPVLKRLRDADSDEQKAAIKGELTKILESYFDQDMNWRSNELESIEQRVKRLRDQLDQRRQAKDEILQLQLKVLENEAAGLGFFGQGSAGGAMGEAGMMGPMGGYPGIGYGGAYGMEMGGYGTEPGMAAPITPVPQPFTKRIAAEFQETPLDQVLDWLRDASQANIYVDQTALKTARVAMDAPVTIQLKDVAVATVLDLVTDSLSGSLGIRYEDEIAVVGLRHAPSPAMQSPWGSDASEASKRTEQRLADAGDYDFVETPLSQVIEFFQDAAGVDAFVNTRAIGEIGVAPNATVSLRLKNVKHRTALRLILDSVNKSLLFAVVDGVVVISASKPAYGEGGEGYGYEDMYGGYGGEMPASAPVEPKADDESPETEAAETPDAAPPRADAALHRMPVSGAEDVAILEAELRAAKSRLDLTAAMHLQGGATALELQESRSAVEITEQKLAKAMREYAAQERLLELDLQQARTNLDAAQAELDESREINQRSPGTIPPMQLKRQETAVRQAELEVQRAQTLLDLHRKPGEETTP